MNTIHLLNHPSGYKNSVRGVDIAIAESLKNKNVVFVFQGYLTSSFHRFNMILKKNNIHNYQTSNLHIVLDKLVVTSKEAIDSWIDRNISSNVDLLVIDTMNIATQRFRKSKKLQPCIDNLHYLRDTLDTSILGLQTGNTPWLLKTTIAQYK